MNNTVGSDVTEVQEEGRQETETDEVSTGAVDIKPSETGRDPEVGHTPGKAEGVDEPATQGKDDQPA